MKKIIFSTLPLAMCIFLLACDNSNSNERKSVTAAAETAPVETIDDTHFQITARDGKTFTLEKPKDTAEVTKNDGTVEMTNCLELSQISFENSIKFEKNYVGAFVRIIAPVTSVHAPEFSGLSPYVKLDGGWEVEVDENNPLLEDLSPGDMVVATGIIDCSWLFAAYGDIVTNGHCAVHSTDDVKTTLELYTE